MNTTINLSKAPDAPVNITPRPPLSAMSQNPIDSARKPTAPPVGAPTTAVPIGIVPLLDNPTLAKPVSTNEVPAAKTVIPLGGIGGGGGGGGSEERAAETQPAAPKEIVISKNAIIGVLLVVGVFLLWKSQKK